MKNCTWAAKLLSTIESKAAAKDQLDCAATSVPLNIAEGNGKFSVRDRCRFIEIARGSVLECAACLNVLVAKELCENGVVSSRKRSTVGDRFDADRIAKQSPVSSQ